MRPRPTFEQAAQRAPRRLRANGRLRVAPGLSALLLFALAPAALATAPAELWRTHCKGCHGVDGKADTRIGRSHHVADFTAARFQRTHTDTQLREVIENGSPDDSKMKAFHTRLTEEEITALVRFIRALKPSRR